MFPNPFSKQSKPVIDPQQHLEFLTHVEDSNKEFDIPFLWGVIQNQRRLIFTVVAIAFALSSIYSLRLKDFYTSSAKVLIEKSDQSAYQNPELLKPQFEISSIYYETRAEVIRSRPILEKTVEQLNLTEHYQKYFPSVKQPRQAISILSQKLKVRVLRNTQIIEVSVSDFDSAMSGRIANAVVENFIRESWRERLFLSDQLLEWFPEEGKSLQNRSGLNQLRALDKINESEAISSLPSVMQDPVINRIKQDQVDIDAKMREFSRRYTLEHPKMKELAARAEYLQNEMKAQIEKILVGLKSGLAGQFSVGNAKVLESATTPDSPAGPKRMLIIIFAVLSGLGGALVLAVFLYYLDQNVKREEDIQKIQSTFLGYFPDFALSSTNGSAEALLTERLDSDTKLQDAMAYIKAAILFSMPAERNKLIMLTSVLPEEGKTTLVSSLAIDLAHSGERVLLIDGDLRKPSVHKIFNLKNEKGMTNCLVQGVGPESLAQRIEGPHELYVLTAGPVTPNPSVLLGSAAASRFLENAADHFDRVIIDVPPSLHIPDGLMLASRVHGVVLVFSCGRVHIDVAKKLKQKLSVAGGLVIGAIINRVNYEGISSPYSKYYRQYNKYYHHQPVHSES